MIAKELIAEVSKTRGPILVEVSNFNDTFWVQAVKRDLMFMLAKFEDEDETGFELIVGLESGNAYFSKDFKIS